MPNILEELEKAQNVPFKYAAFSGGGAKGAIYSGVHETLVTSGVLAGMQAVAGSSAGAITAAFIASGITTTDFQKISKETNLEGLLGDGFLINKDGKPLYKLLQDTISKNIINYFIKNEDTKKICLEGIKFVNTQLNNLQKKNTHEVSEEITALNARKAKLEELQGNDSQIQELHQRVKSGGEICFKDIDLLHTIDPITFKDLVITATNRSTGDLTIFDARKTPDVEIALACRASASIPIIFEPVKINGVEYVDGGYRDNIPQNHFKTSRAATVSDSSAQEITNDKSKIKKAKQTGRTLALAFGSDAANAAAHIAVYMATGNICSAGIVAKFLMDVVFKFAAQVGGSFSYSEEENKTYKNLRKNALNAVILDTKDVGTLSFKEAQNQAEYLHVKGAITTSRHFDNHNICKNTDPCLATKEFMLEVYESTQNKGVLDKIKDKIIGGKDEKLQQLLSFCKPEKWQTTAPEDMLSSFVATAATNRFDGRASINTNTMNKLVEILNKPDAPSLVKNGFIKLLGQNTNNLKSSAGVIEHKFTTKDFSKFVAQQNEKLQKQKLEMPNKQQEQLSPRANVRNNPPRAKTRC